MSRPDRPDRRLEVVAGRQNPLGQASAEERAAEPVGRDPEAREVGALLVDRRKRRSRDASVTPA